MIGGVTALLIGIIGLVAFFSLQQFNRSFSVMIDNTVPTDQVLRTLRGDAQDILASADQLALLIVSGTDTDQIDGEYEDFKNAESNLLADVQQLAIIPLAPGEPASELVAPVGAGVQRLISAANAFVDGFATAHLLSLTDAGASSSASPDNSTAGASADSSAETPSVLPQSLRDLQLNFEQVETEFLSELDEFVSVEADESLQFQTDSVAALQNAILAIFGVAAVSLVVSILGAVVGSRQISRPIVALIEVAQKLTRGDYSQRADVSSFGEFGTLSRAFNTMTDTVLSRQQELSQLNATLEKRVRERTREAEAARRVAEENNRLKSEFLATMSHELRTPLNAIEGFTSIIRNHMGGTEYNASTARYVDRIEANSKRLLQLINDFLDISRIESGRLQLAHSPFSPTELGRRWADLAGGLAEKSGLGFEVSLDPSLPESIVGDEEAVSKIAINLLGNAVKFTEKGNVELALKASGDNWQIVVSDTGIGIPPHAREFIFDEFRQVDQTSKRKFGGTGLGLAIVQKMARAMGGTVTVESEVGHGSTFTVTLPIVLEEPITASA